MIKKLMMLCVAAMAAMASYRLNAEMQIGLSNNYAYREGEAIRSIDGRKWHYVEMEEYVCHFNTGYKAVPWAFECGWDKLDNICIPVTGCGREKIVPVITLGTAMKADRLKASVLTDAEFAARFHLGELEFETDDDGDFEYESVSKRLIVEFPRSVWPNGKVIDSRQWILVSLANVRIGQDGFFSPKTFTVGIKGTNLVTPTITICPDSTLPETTRFTPSNLFGFGVTMNSPIPEEAHFDPFFELWDCGLGADRVPYVFDTGDAESGLLGSITFSIPSAGELYLKIENQFYTGDSWNLKTETLRVSGSAYGGEFRTIGNPSSQDFWVIFNAKKQGSLTIGNFNEDLLVNGIWFRPSSVSEAGCLATEAWCREGIIVADDVQKAIYRGFVTGMGVVPFGQKAKLVCYPNEGEELDHWEFVNCQHPNDATVNSTTLTFTVTKALYDQIEAEDESIKRIIVQPVFRKLENYEPKLDVLEISASVAPVCEGMGVVSGGGKTVKSRTQIALKATANKGYAFIGWYDEEGKPFPNEKEYRIAQLSYTTGHSDVNAFAQFLKSSGNITVSAKAEAGMVFAGWYTEYQPENDAFVKPYISSEGKDYRTASMSYPVPLYAALFPRFVSTDEDMQISLTCSPEAYYDANSPMSLGVLVDSCSIPTVTAANLPAGLKFDAKTLQISGTPTKPGEGKDVTFTVKNLTNKKGATFAVSIKIGDAKAPSLSDLKYNGADGGYAPFVPGAEQDMAKVLGTNTMVVLAQGGWTVSGLPAGMKFDSKTGKFSGAPTKANENCTVTFKKGTEIATITLRTGALPPLNITSYLIDDGNDSPVVIPESRAKDFKVTGAGGYAVGKAATLSATAPKGYVFAGWYTDAECTIPAENGTQDYRTASSYKFTMPEDATSETGVRLYAMFIHASHDFAVGEDIWSDEITVELNQSESMPADFIRNAVYSGSLPTVTVKGLPAGLKFDAKTLLTSGKATDKTPKWYDLIVSVKNSAGYTYTGIFGVSVNGGMPAEDIDELGVLWQLDWLDYLYVGCVIDSDIDSDEGPEGVFGSVDDGISQVTGLPAEMKVVKEEGYFIIGPDDICIKTPGVYTVTINGKIDGKAAKTTKRYVIRDRESLYERVLVANGCEDMGTVTGNGTVVHPGTSFSINATAKKGYVFAGWYADPDCHSRAFFMPEFADFRQASQKAASISIDTGSEDLDIALAPTVLNPTTWYAKFVEKSADSEVRIRDVIYEEYPGLHLGEFVYDFDLLKDDEFDVEIQLAVESESLPTITFKGLPSWMDKDPHQYFDGFWLWYNGKSEPVPGEYSFTMTAKNASGAVDEKKLTIRVPNYRNEDLHFDYENGYTLVPGVVFTPEMLMPPGLDLRGWTVTGLPDGMKFDPKTGKFSGAPTKPDTSYTVWFKKIGEETATITMRTKPFPVLELEPIVAGHGNDLGLMLDESISVPDISQFKLTGAGAYIAGKEVTLGAKAPAGWVFAGWQDRSGSLGFGMNDIGDMFLDANSNDTRVAAYKLKMPPNERLVLRGVFIHQSQDSLMSMMAMNATVEIYGGQSLNIMNARLVRDMFIPMRGMCSFPTVTAKGLPAGIKLDAKNNLLSGKVTAAPGCYYTTFTAKNLSGYTYTMPVKFFVHKSFEDLSWDMSDPADVDTIPEEACYSLGLEYLNWMKTGSMTLFRVGYIPKVDTEGIYESNNWGYMIPESVADLGFFDKFGYRGDIQEMGVASISGLPKGLTVVKDSEQWTDPDGYFSSWTEYETKEGSVPTEAGWTRFTLTAKYYDGNDESKKGEFSKMVPVWDAHSRYVHLKVAGAGGAVTGGGVWNAGKQYTITATPAKNYAFAGWYTDSACTMPAMNWTFGAECDYRTAKQKWTLASLSNYSEAADMGIFEHVLYAKFIPIAEVSEPKFEILGYDLEYELENPPTWFGSFEDGSLVLNIENDYSKLMEGNSDFGFRIKADVLPQVSIKGLPKNVHLDAIYADGLCCIEFCEGSEDLLSPGIYPVTLTVKVNTKTFTYPFTINIGNKKSGMYDGWLGVLDYSKDAYQMDIGVISEMPFLTQPDDEDFSVAIKGLPAGVKWDPVTGVISGIPTKAGVYTVTVLTTCYGGEFTAEDTVTMTVNALPDWVVGTFRGSVITEGWGWGDASSFEVTISKTGIVTAKINEAIPGEGSIVLKPSSLYVEDEGFAFGWDMEWGVYEWCRGMATISQQEKDGVVLGVLTAYEDGVDEDEDYWEANWKGYQDAYVAKSANLPLPVFGTDKTLYVPIDEDGGITLTFGANGKVSISEPGHAVVWASSNLLPLSYDVEDGKVEASLWIMGADEYWCEDCEEYEYETFGAEIILTIPVDAKGNAKASKTLVKAIRPGVNF